MHSLLTEMQQSITTEMKTLRDSVSALSCRLDKQEDTVSSNTEIINGSDVLRTPASTTPGSSSCESGGRKRKRQIPTALSVSEVSVNVSL